MGVFLNSYLFLSGSNTMATDSLSLSCINLGNRKALAWVSGRRPHLFIPASPNSSRRFADHDQVRHPSIISSVVCHQWVAVAQGARGHLGILRRDGMPLPVPFSADARPNLHGGGQLPRTPGAQPDVTETYKG